MVHALARARVAITLVTCQVHCCQGWLTSSTLSSGALPRRMPSSGKANVNCNLWTRRTCSRSDVIISSSGSVRRSRLTLPRLRRRPSASMADTEVEGFKGGEGEGGGEEAEIVEDESWDPDSMFPDELPRVKMDESPLPEYLVDMLREAGHVDKDGKPLNDPFNPWDDEEMEGSRTERERLIKEQEADYFDVPYGEMLFEDGKMNLDDQYGLMDTTISEAAQFYNFPLEFFHDSLTRWGVLPPIDENVRLGNLINAEQAFSLGEALTGLDPADVRDNYINESLEDLAVELQMPLPDIFHACAATKINLPQGADTHLGIEDYRELLNAVMDDGESSDTRRLFELSLASNRWAGQKELKLSAAEQILDENRLAKHTRGIGWKNGPPVVGMREGQILPDEIHISGNIFAEEFLKFAAQDGGGSGAGVGEDDDFGSLFDLDVGQAAEDGFLDVNYDM